MYIEILLFLCCSAIGLQIEYTNDKQINKNFLKLHFFWLTGKVLQIHVCPGLKPFDNICVLTKAKLEVGEEST